MELVHIHTPHYLDTEQSCSIISELIFIENDIIIKVYLLLLFEKAVINTL